MKMTNPRRELLTDIAAGRRTISDSYPPLKWLLLNDLVKVAHIGKYGSVTYEITEAGRKALTEAA